MGQKIAFVSYILTHQTPKYPDDITLLCGLKSPVSVTLKPDPCWQIYEHKEALLEVHKGVTMGGAVGEEKLTVKSVISMYLLHMTSYSTRQFIFNPSAHAQFIQMMFC